MNLFRGHVEYNLKKVSIFELTSKINFCVFQWKEDVGLLKFLDDLIKIFFMTCRLWDYYGHRAFQ